MAILIAPPPISLSLAAFLKGDTVSAVVKYFLLSSAAFFAVSMIYYFE